MDPVTHPEIASSPGSAAAVPVTVEAPAGDTVPSSSGRRKAIVYAARTALVMLAVAAAVLLGLGGVAMVRADNPEIGGWLRAVFGQVFGVVAISLAAILGIPSLIGLWGLAGSTGPEAIPALPRLARMTVASVAIAATALTALIVLVTGTSVTILNLALAALVGMSSLGLAGAAAFSRHRWRAVLSGVAAVLVALGALWVINVAFR